MPNAQGLTGAAFKRSEDGLDALTCAYTVFWYWWHGPEGADVVGDPQDGYIVVPRRGIRSAAAIER